MIRYIVEYNKMNFGKYISLKIIGHDYILSNNIVTDTTSFIYKNFIYNDVFYKNGRPIDFIGSDIRDLINKYNLQIRLNKLNKIL